MSWSKFLKPYTNRVNFTVRKLYFQKGDFKKEKLGRQSQQGRIPTGFGTHGRSCLEPAWSQPFPSLSLSGPQGFSSAAGLASRSWDLQPGLGEHQALARSFLPSLVGLTQKSQFPQSQERHTKRLPYVPWMPLMRQSQPQQRQRVSRNEHRPSFSPPNPGQSYRGPEEGSSLPKVTQQVRQLCLRRIIPRPKP